MGRWSEKSAAERLENRLAPPDANGCQLWRPPLTAKGYGRLKVGDRLVLAHRFAYELARGPVPPGLELDHLCRNRACCNPEHLEAVTHKENVRRGDVFARWAARTHCDNGHEYTPENTAYRRSGTRLCRQCRRDYVRAWKERAAA